MSQADLLIDQLAAAQFPSALDLMKGYLQVPMLQGNKGEKASSPLQDLFQLKLMFFMLCRPQLHFSRFDNIIIFSSEWCSHLYSRH